VHGGRFSAPARDRDDVGLLLLEGASSANSITKMPETTVTQFTNSHNRATPAGRLNVGAESTWPPAPPA
jgi:hypothetical protein